MSDNVLPTRLAYKKTGDYDFKYKNHGFGRLVNDKDLTISAGGVLEIDTGLKFMLVSDSEENASMGYFYAVVPAINCELKAQIQGITPQPVDCPFMVVACYEPYNLNKKNPDGSAKSTLKLRLFVSPSVTTACEILAGSTICYLTFQVIYDLQKTVSCFSF